MSYVRPIYEGCHWGLASLQQFCPRLEGLIGKTERFIRRLFISLLEGQLKHHGSARWEFILSNPELLTARSIRHYIPDVDIGGLTDSALGGYLRKIEANIPKEDFEAQRDAILSVRQCLNQLQAEESAGHALSLVGKGTYTLEGNGFISSNYPDWPPYLLNEFKVLFANWSKQNSFEFNFIKKIATENYANGKLAMNCWEFVLLVMYEKKMITIEDIENLYLYQTKAKLERWVELWRPLASKTPAVGDIALFFGSTLSHVAIVTSVNPLEITEMLDHSVSTRGISEINNVGFVNMHQAVAVIKQLERVDPKEYRQYMWQEKELSLLLRRNILCPQIDQELDRRYQLWREREQKSAEQLLSPKELDAINRFYPEPDRAKIFEDSLKKEYHKNHCDEVETFILEKNGIFLTAPVEKNHSLSYPG